VSERSVEDDFRGDSSRGGLTCVLFYTQGLFEGG
jgi:hypothetical protein